MSEIIATEPKLFVGTKEEFAGDSEALARINRLISLSNSIGKYPVQYMHAFLELGEEATADTLDLHDESIETRTATGDPKKRIKEYFAKRDDKEIRPDPATEEAIFSSKEFRELSQISREKRAISVKTGAMKSEIRENPEAREASNAVRRYILGEYIGRALLFDSLQQPKKGKQAG